ncbi:MAG: hypothetical protein JRJ85_04620, partial [Deltaproteobacteria bacterium]|nr:hypothetical protein [Deltaproteobacteria bacterium]
GENRDAIPAPASRLFPAFDTEKIKLMHRGSGVELPPSPQLLPQKRLEMITNFLRNIQIVRFGDAVLDLDLDAISEKQQYYIPPPLLFGKSYVLRYGEISSYKHADNPERLVSDWIKAKIPALQQHGVYSCPALPRFYLWTPSNWQRQLRDKVKDFMNSEIKRQCKDKHFNFIPRVYGGSDELLRGLKRTESENALNLIGLPNNIPQGTYARIKQIRTVKTQCFSENTAQRIHEASFRRNLALAALIDAGVKPWVLESDLNYDVYVGIDVLQNRSAFHFFWGDSARNMRFWPGHSVSQARRQEAIKARHLNKSLIEGLNHIFSEMGKPIQSITIHRDGRWWPSEQDGLDNAVKTLTRAGVLAEDLKLAVVEIRKTHLPVRLLMRRFDRGSPFFANPVPGVYRIINKDQMLMVTTWNPVHPDAEYGRTSGSILLNVAYSSPIHDIKEIGEDVYSLTQLNWSAPGIEINVPVTIRWADHRLRETLLKTVEAEDDDTEFEEDESDVEED